MKTLVRWSIACLAPTLLTGGALVAYPDLAREAGLDFWNMPGLRDAADRERLRERELEAMYRAIDRRLRVKRELVRELIAGERTLAEVTDHFERLNRSAPVVVGAIRRYYPGRDDREKTARHVIRHAEAALADSPSRREEVRARLEEELWRMAHGEPR
ncbi:MAG TPA: hypothetical protein VIL46_16765 [Gemmataceae bacterium]